MVDATLTREAWAIWYRPTRTLMQGTECETRADARAYRDGLCRSTADKNLYRVVKIRITVEVAQ